MFKLSFKRDLKNLVLVDIRIRVFKSPFLAMGFPGCSEVKNPPAMQKTQVQSLGQEDPLEKGMATHFSILPWRIPWTEDPGVL